MAELSVKIGADVKELERQLNKAEKELKGFDKIAAKSSKAVGSLNKKTANATPTLQEFSRVIQDAPFGIQGVANNIQQLTGNFTNLQKSAGGTVPALKLVAKSFVGPAGILFAVSTITSLLVVYGDKLKKTAGLTEQLSQKTNEFTSQVNTETSQLKALLTISRDETQSKEVRQRAINQLNKDYGKYLGNLTLESVKTEEVTNKVKALTQALLNKARVRGAEALLEEKFKELAEKTNKVLEQQGDFSRRRASEQIQENREKLQAQQQALKTLEEEQKKGRDVANAISIVTKEIERLKEASKLSGRDIIAEGLLSEAIKKETSNLEQDIKAIEVVLKRALEKSFQDIDLNVKASESQVRGELKKVSSDLKPIGIEPFRLNVDAIKTDLESIDLSKFDNKIRETSEVSKIALNSVGNSFGALASQISTHLQTGNAVLDTFISSFIQGLAQLAASQLQSLVIDKGIAIAKNQVNKSVSSGNAITAATSAAAAAGPAGPVILPGLIASQLAIVNGAFAAIQAFAKGGFSGDNNLAFLNKNELVLRPMEQAALYNALRSSSLGSLASNTTQRLGMTPENNIEGVIRGNDLLLVNRRSSRKMRRNFNS